MVHTLMEKSQATEYLMFDPRGPGKHGEKTIRKQGANLRMDIIGEKRWIWDDLSKQMMVHYIPLSKWVSSP